MRPFKRPPTLTTYCSQCFNRPLSTTVTATRKRRKLRLHRKQIDESLQERASILRTLIHEARTTRREDWILGPLAPRRDIGGGEYGTVTKRELKGVTKGLARGVLTNRANGGITAAGKRGEKGVGMSWEQSLIYEGDRVAIMSGTGPESRDKGEIGRVTEVRKGTREVVIDGLNMAYLNTNMATSEHPDSPLIESVALPMPLSSVRLVRKLRDPNTGIVADKIVSRLIRLPDEKRAEIRAEFKAGSIDKEEMKGRMKARTIPGSKEVYGDWLEIPVPESSGKKEDTDKDKEHNDNTLRYEVESQTWKPTLMTPPMPHSVIDELRNKYSRFRTRHEPYYQLALDNRARRKAERDAWIKSGGGMLTLPAQAARRAEREKLKEKGAPTLEKEVLERIGEVMARKGIEMTGKRRRAMAKNLSKEGVVKWGDDVEGVGKKPGAGTAVLEDEEDGDGDEDDDEDDDEEGWEDVTLEEDKPREEKRPTL